MTAPEIMTGVALAISAANCLLMFLTFRRAAAWKEGEEAQALIRRIGACESDVTVLKGKDAGHDGLANRLAAAEGVITGLGTRMENVATKADVARLTAEFVGIERHIKSVEGGVERIEGFLMNSGRGHA